MQSLVGAGGLRTILWPIAPAPLVKLVRKRGRYIHTGIPFVARSDARACGTGKFLKRRAPLENLGTPLRNRGRFLKICGRLGAGQDPLRLALRLMPD